MGGVGSGVGRDGRGEDLEARAADARLGRMDRVAVLYAEITAATRTFLAALAESDRHRDWEAEGFGSCAEWLAWRLGITRNTANEKVRTARALEHLPLTSEAMARGELSFSKVRALTRAATAENEAELLELARAGSAAKLERMIRGWKRSDRADEARRERALHAARTFSVFPDEDGMYLVRGRLPAEVGALLMRAVEAASDALYRREQGGTEEEEEHATDPAQRRADALGLLAERALAAGFGGEAGGEGTDVPISGARAQRYQVMLHVEAGGLTEAGQAELSELGDGTRVPAGTARRLACDATRVRVATDARAPRYRRDSLVPWSVEAAAREALDPWDDDSKPAAREALDDDEHEAAA